MKTIIFSREVKFENFVRGFMARQDYFIYFDGWMDELGFYVPSTVFQLFRDDGRMNMKGSVQWSAV